MIFLIGKCEIYNYQDRKGFFGIHHDLTAIGVIITLQYGRLITRYLFFENKQPIIYMNMKRKVKIGRSNLFFQEHKERGNGFHNKIRTHARPDEKISSCRTVSPSQSL
jgi:hypothetical protein